MRREAAVTWPNTGVDGTFVTWDDRKDACQMFFNEETETMRTITIAALTLGALVLGTVDRAANAAEGKSHAANAEPRRVWIRVPRGSCGRPDYYIVPRYCYDPRDDRVDTSPYAKPVAQVHGLEYGGPGL